MLVIPAGLEPATYRLGIIQFASTIEASIPRENRL